MSESDMDNLILRQLPLERKEQLLKSFGLIAELPTALDAIRDDEVYTVQDIADLLKLSPQHVRRLCRSGKLPSLQVASQGKHIIFGKHIKQFLDKNFYRNPLNRL